MGRYSPGSCAFFLDQTPLALLSDLRDDIVSGFELVRDAPKRLTSLSHKLDPRSTWLEERAAYPILDFSRRSDGALCELAGHASLGFAGALEELAIAAMDELHPIAGEPDRRLA